MPPLEHFLHGFEVGAGDTVLDGEQVAEHTRNATKLVVGNVVGAFGYFLEEAASLLWSYVNLIGESRNLTAVLVPFV